MDQRVSSTDYLVCIEDGRCGVIDDTVSYVQYCFEIYTFSHILYIPAHKT
jgi:hypothetical protein